MSAVVVYGDTNANIIDGSSVWLMSVSEVLSGVFDEVHLLLKAVPENDTLLQAIRPIANIEVHAPSVVAEDGVLDAESAAELAQELVAKTGAEAVVVRGLEAAFEFTSKEKLSPIVWAYVTDLPFPPSKLSDTNLNRLHHIAAHSKRVFAQTEAARSYWEGLVPQAAGKVILIPPMIPWYAYGKVEEDERRQHDLRLIYAGKLAKEWRTLEMLELPRVLRKRGVNATLEVVGTKFNRARNDPTWVSRMRAALEEADRDSSSGVSWLGGLPRHESVSRIKRADIGLGWRSRELDSSLELSTKALEYASTGTAPVVNLTEDHKSLFGATYPFFVSAEATVEEIADTIIAGLPKLKESQAGVRSVAEYFSMENAQKRLSESFKRAGLLGQKPRARSSKPVRLVVASHDLKFMGELMDYLETSPEFEVRIDRWATLHEHDVSASEALAGWADVVFCEWAGPSLSWYSQNLPHGVALVARLHRFELNGPWMRQVKWENVDRVVFVSDWIRRQAIQRFPLSDVGTAVIPNSVDTYDFNRPKVGNAQFTLGLVGMVPFLKRPDRALDFLEQLLEVDDRYILRIKGRMPWEYPHVWSDSVEKQLYLDFFERVSTNSVLQEHVVFDGFSADVASWFRSIGFILSCSELESFHLAPAEGMAAGAIPLLWKRDGAREVFGSYAVHTGHNERLSKVLELRGAQSFNQAMIRSKTFASQWDVSTVLPAWRELFLGLAKSSDKTKRKRR
ncbi:glycosyltransferase [Corynebacterium minutissimum]|uniref:Glycosyl transferases group 1 n=1 Tax=Corynebacterium minutissimum TaxID=38301 RepID=A0A376D1E9_9CORY|nr:glycosyltransferase [Corynebacterium minutissimum]QRP61482.1 glycosyltransferase family 4 protein [Corynebacterium minutissimum]STC79967.1 Glycosyl transferases group 1 [Corynebacterium minutissimum]